MIATNASSTSPQSGGKYYPQLDALRALAVGVVLAQHWLHGMFERVGIHGSYGVWIFFTLSGYLITGILIRYRESVLAGEVSLGRVLKVFFIRRFLRILPAYYLLLFIALFFGRLNEENALWHLLYLSNFYFMMIGQFPTMGHLWSLSVEEQFYLIWPFLVVSLAHYRLAIGIGLAILGAFLFRCLSVAEGWVLAEYVMPVAALDTLGLGALLAWIHFNQNDLIGRLLRFAQFPALALLAVIGFLPDPYFKVIAPLIVGLASTYFIQRCVTGMSGLVGAVASIKPILFLGKISYGLYLYHGLAVWILPDTSVQFLGLGYYEGLAVVILVRGILLLAIATLSWLFWEQPFNRLKKSWTLTSPTVSFRA